MVKVIYDKIPEHLADIIGQTYDLYVICPKCGEELEAHTYMPYWCLSCFHSLPNLRSMLKEYDNSSKHKISLTHYHIGKEC